MEELWGLRPPISRRYQRIDLPPRFLCSWAYAWLVCFLLQCDLILCHVISWVWSMSVPPGISMCRGPYLSAERLAPIIIPVTRRVKGYTRFVGKYVTGRRKRFRPHKAYIFLIRITSPVDIAVSVCPSVRMNAVILEIKSWYTGIGHADSRDSCAAQICF